MKNFAEAIVNSKNIVFFTGAGVSTPSGLKDYRGNNGLASEGIKLEERLHRDNLYNNPEDFWELWNRKMAVSGDIAPNVIHETIALLGTARNVTVVTQNIDGLHERAGHATVLALHGSGEIIETADGIKRPNVVLYGERLDIDLMMQADLAIRDSDMLIILGTSLEVYPAARLINSHRKNNVWIINNKVPELDSSVPFAAHMIKGDLVKFFEPLHRVLSANLEVF